MEDYITSQHRYYTFNYYLQKKYNHKVFKVALNGNFSCPNRDGTISKNGCIFCSPSGSGDFAGNKNDSLETQFKMVKDIIELKWPNSYYIVYFQANTNTYKPLNELINLYETAISLSPKIKAISIATRPDSISDDVINYLGYLNTKIPVWIELGFQTSNESTAALINRGYKNEILDITIKKLRAFNIEVIVHIINGLPYETKDDMYNTVKYLNKLDINGIKIHSLFVLKNTILGKMYLNKEFEVMEMTDYIEVTANQIALLKPNIVIHRINGDAPKDLLIAPKWSEKKLVVMNEIDKYMKNNDLYQGKKYKEED